MTRPRKALARPQRAVIDAQALLRQLQKALAVARCIRVAAEYGQAGEVDVTDAIAGLLLLLEGATALLDQPGSAP